MVTLGNLLAPAQLSFIPPVPLLCDLPPCAEVTGCICAGSFLQAAGSLAAASSGKGGMGVSCSPEACSVWGTQCPLELSFLSQMYTLLVPEWGVLWTSLPKRGCDSSRRGPSSSVQCHLRGVGGGRGAAGAERGQNQHTTAARRQEGTPAPQHQRGQQL